MKWLLNFEVANICAQVAIKLCEMAIIGYEVAYKYAQVAINTEKVANKNCIDSHELQ